MPVLQVSEGGELAVFILYVSLGMLVVIGGVGMHYVLRRSSARPPHNLPYECGEQPIGSAYASFTWPFLRIVALLLVLEAEVVLVLPWVWVQSSIASTVFWVEMGILLLPAVGLYAYAIRSGWLSVSQVTKSKRSLPPAYRQLNAYLLSQGRGPSSYSSRPSEALPPLSPHEPSALQTP